MTITERVDRISTFRVTLASLLVTELFSGVLQFYFTPIYPALGAKFHVGIGTLSWALTGYTLATAVFTPLFAKLADVYGHAKVLKIETAIVAIGCILIAVAPVFWLLVVGRVLQGTFAAFLPVMFGLIRHRHSHDETTRAISYLSGVLIFGILAGLFSISLLLKLDNGVQWVLWLPAIGVTVGFILQFFSHGRPFARPEGSRVDWLGVVLLAVGFALVIFGLNQGPKLGWGSPATLGLLVLGIILLAMWVLVELRTHEPMVDVRYVFRPHLVPVYIIGFIIFFGVIGAQVAISTFMGLPHSAGGLGLDASQIGFATLPGFAVMFILIMFTPMLGRAIGFRWTITVGCICFLVGFGGLLFAHTSLAGYLIFYWIVSGGFGFIEASTRTIVVHSLREGEISVGAGVYELSITVGGAIGAGVIGAILAGSATAAGVATIDGYMAVWGLLGVLGVIVTAVAIGYALRGSRTRRETAMED